MLGSVQDEEDSVNASDVVAYTYEASVHCAECTRRRFGDAAVKLDGIALDREGNLVTPMSAGDAAYYCGSLQSEGVACDAVYCDDCGECVFEFWTDPEYDGTV